MARPSSYSEAIALEIAARMIEKGASLKTIAEAEDMPSLRTMLEWCRHNSDFERLLAHARMEKTHQWVEGSVEISDEAVQTLVEVARNRLRVQARLDAAAKLWPARYGPKIGIGGARDVPLFEKHISPNDLARAVCFALASGRRIEESDDSR